jgi:hypothetical protein
VQGAHYAHGRAGRAADLHQECISGGPDAVGVAGTRGGGSASARRSEPAPLGGSISAGIARAGGPDSAGGWILTEAGGPQLDSGRGWIPAATGFWPPSRSGRAASAQPPRQESLSPSERRCGGRARPVDEAGGQLHLTRHRDRLARWRCRGAVPQRSLEPHPRAALAGVCRTLISRGAPEFGKRRRGTMIGGARGHAKPSVGHRGNTLGRSGVPF